MRLSGATIPANGACSVSVRVLSNIPGSYTNTFAAGSVSTAEGVSNEEPTSARLLVSTPPTDFTAGVSARSCVSVCTQCSVHPVIVTLNLRGKFV